MLASLDDVRYMGCLMLIGDAYVLVIVVLWSDANTQQIHSAHILVQWMGVCIRLGALNVL